MYRFLATGEDTNGNYAIWEAIVPPGHGPPSHVHSREEEGFYILEGEITFRSVVTREIPGGVFGAGNPCRVIREITE